METFRVLLCTNGITQRIGTVTGENGNYLQDQEKKSCSEPHQQTLFGCGDDSSTTASTTAPESDKQGLTVPSSETNQASKAANSFAKRTRLLMRCGLIAGITPTSIRKTLGADCQAHVLFPLGGDTSGEADTEPGQAAGN